MAVYGNLVLTSRGLNLYSKAQTGTTLNFTRMQIGSGQLGGTDPTTLTALINPIGFFSINSQSNVGNMSYIKGIFQNTALNSSTYTCEIGIFATDPTLGEILYAYATAGAQGDTIPAYSAGPLSKQFTFNVAIGNAASVTATVPSTTYVPVTDKGAANGVATLDATSQIPVSQLGNATVAAATTTVKGSVLVSAAPASGTPVALTRVANVSESLIANTSAQSIASYTPTVSGNFLIFVSVRVVIGATNVAVEVDYNDAGGAQVNNLYPNASVAPGTHALGLALFINAVAGTPIVIKLTAGVANQVYASASILGV